MRSKTILSIAAFVVAFGFSVFLASLFISKPASETFVLADYNSRATSCFKQRYQSPTAREISSLLRQDVSNGRERDRDLRGIMNDWRTPFGESNYDEFTEIMQQYVDDSSSLNADELPANFQDAWHKHMKAWRDYSDFLNDVKNSGEPARFSNEKLLRLDGKYSAEINSTWYEVLRIGRTHGAEVY